MSLKRHYLGAMAAVLAGAVAFAPSFDSTIAVRQPKRRFNERRRPVASAKRSRSRLAAKAKFARQLRKEREIGVDPIFLHGSYDRRMDMRPGWLKQSKAWDQANA